MLRADSLGKDCPEVKKREPVILRIVGTGSYVVFYLAFELSISLDSL